MELTDNAMEVLRSRILQPNETFEDMTNRVSSFIARDNVHRNIYKQLLHDRVFLPNSPCLMGAGTALPQLSACFVLPIEDSMESIFEAVKETALVHRSGGGTGFSFSKLRSSGSTIRSTNGIASGPTSFMKVFNAATEQVKQGGRRKGANMAVLNNNHPDIFNFLTAKVCEGDLQNFNISVGVLDNLFKDDYTELVEPHTGEVINTVSSAKLLDEIARSAHSNGEPGLLFLDTINNDSPHISPFDRINACNPCGEIPALPYEACVLGSINLNSFISDQSGYFDFNGLAEVSEIATNFLNDCIDVSEYPLPQIESMVKHMRRIGLGVMGLADVFYKLELPYNSVEARDLANYIAQTINDASHKRSTDDCLQYDPAPGTNFTRRNVATTAIAPTGTLSLIANCSSGIEPHFSLNHERRVLNGKRLIERNQDFQKALERKGVDIRGDLPYDLRRVFVTAPEISPRDHILMQTTMQEHVDSGISKTINMPLNSTVEDVKNIIRTAWHFGCKGLTIYRTGSREEEVYCKICD